jgi:hypothetical protein
MRTNTKQSKQLQKMVKRNKIRERHVIQFGPTMSYIWGGERTFLWFNIQTMFTMDQIGYKKLAQQVHKGQT